MSQLAVGVMSGTSGDGVSVVLAEFRKKSYKLIAYETFPYPKEISKKIESAIQFTTPEISSLNFELGNIFARCVVRLLTKHKIKFSRVAVIGSHGQTIFHSPNSKIPSTFQIGEPAVIAEKTGITVVSDFRSQDIASGGQGAPLIPFFDYYFFGDKTVRAFQNVGGIANVAVVGKGILNPIAFDTCPGNCLIDWAVKKISNNKLSFDKNGSLAKKGRIFIDVVNQMYRHAYFKKIPPKSTGKELFNEKFVPPTLKKKIYDQPYDVLNTLTYFTAYTIAESYKKFIFPKYKLSEIVISGGGAFNQTLMEHLKNLFVPVPVCSIQKYGIHPQAKEPLAFAFFALWAIHGKINHLSSTTGASHSLVLGKITLGTVFK